MKPNGYTLYEGPSLFDGAPICAIVTGFKIGTKNAKMDGRALQTWILHRDLGPIEAVKTGADKAICGDCAMRGRGDGTGRACYVEYHMGVRNLWLAYKRGNYPVVDRPIDICALGSAQVVRLGSYGDPAMVPFPVWRCLTDSAAWSMGYTHQWRSCDPRLKRLCMASVENSAQQALAVDMGWRTFRVRGPADRLYPGEVICPASAEAGKKTTCEACRACGGTKAKARANVAIIAHGSLASVANFERGPGR